MENLGREPNDEEVKLERDNEWRKRLNASSLEPPSLCSPRHRRLL